MRLKGLAQKLMDRTSNPTSSFYKYFLATKKSSKYKRTQRNRTRNASKDDPTDRDAQSQADRDLRTTQGAGNQQIPPRKAKNSNENSNYENCQVCGGSFKIGRGLRIHLSKSKSGCKRILESRKSKSRISTTQEQHHSGFTDSQFPDVEASNREAPEQKEMWSIFSRYPETLSQCIGRKLKLLRLESARIALHDEVEMEVKARITEEERQEERAQKEILVIDNEEERLIREGLNLIEEEVMPGGRVKSARKGKGARKSKMKSMVSRPDIRSWLNNQSDTKRSAGLITQDRGEPEVVVISNDDIEVPKSKVRSTVSQPDLRQWLCTNLEKQEYRNARIEEAIVPDLEDVNNAANQMGRVVKRVQLEPDLRCWLRANGGKEVVNSSPPDVVKISDITSADQTEQENRSDVAQPDLRQMLSKSGKEESKTTELPPEIIISSDEDDNQTVKNKVKSCVSQPDIREWLNTKSRGKPLQSRVSNRSDGPLSDQEAAYREIVRTLNKGQPDEILSNFYLQMTRRDYRSLDGNNYLNDKVIDEYLQLIKKRNAEDGLLKVYPLTTHAYSWLDGNFDQNYDKVASWCRDMMDTDIVLAPIHKADHWSLIEINIRTQTLSYYDSIYGNRKRSNAPKVMKRFIEQYWRKMEKTIKLRVKVIENAPLQNNGYDCGVFVCQNAEKIARGALVNTRQADMPNARKTMMKGIFFGTLKIETKPDRLQIEPPKVARGARKKQPEKVRKVTVKARKVETVNDNKSGKSSGAGKPKINWPKSNGKE